MLRRILLILLLIYTATAESQLRTHKNVIRSEIQIRTVISTFPDQTFDSHFQQINPFVLQSDTTIEDELKEKEKIVYKVIYHTEKYGFRKTPKPSLTDTHLILGGDSNMFGIGVQDEETLPSRLAEKLSSVIVLNAGLVGVGPNSLLYFLQNYSLAPLLGEKKKGLMIYDFHHHLFDRVAGSKIFLSWSKEAPRYALEDGRLVYKGVFEEYLPARFYLFLNKLPWHEKLFPNLPRLTDDHILLTARVLKEIKDQYLNQTERGNRFIVSFNPAYQNEKFQEHVTKLQQTLKGAGIETITFNTNEILPLPVIPGEVHQSALAHKNYAEMLLKKLADK